MTVSTVNTGAENFFYTEVKETSYRLTIHYESQYGQHNDDIYIQKNNIRTLVETLPAVIKSDLKDNLSSINHSETDKTYDYIKGRLFNNDNQLQTISVSQDDFIRHLGHNVSIEPRFGRFYPATLFNTDKLALCNTISNKLIPIRIIDLKYKEMLVNIGHPLSNYNTTLTIKKFDPQPDRESEIRNLFAPPLLDKRHLPDFLTGPGMQLRYADQATDFFSDDAFQRTDESLDCEFYFQPRHTNHLDETALIQLKSAYSELIPKQSEILDLMSSINSHIDNKLKSKKIIGLGLNNEELAANPALDESVLHDINQNPKLPFDDNSFDIIICSLSIEYITQPSQLFDEVARLLRSGGRLIISFSNRWFPTKSIQVWNNLHDYERIGIVMEYFIESAHFADINTYSLRGLPRPIDDIHHTALSDPLYIVWADRE